ncbi:MAG: isoleucine--tRNA ligase [Candidatus Buchananbacteria bacterium]|nr:isoleucine--tRNA ligase [Candidatus Buchananbacteria bacterium]
MPEEKSQFAQKEEELIKFWEENKIFEKSIEQRKDAPVFSFYDGPPFASGLPHYGHILASALKDTVTRYWTMRGYKVERTVGWDCHGLPVENLIEKEKEIKSKKEILKLGKNEYDSIKIFNEACAASVFRCVDEWKDIFKRIGRWADYSNQYSTLDNEYIESVWWVFKELFNKGLIYKSYRVSPYCPRCGTPLSNFEVNQGYAKAHDPSIYFKVKIKGEENTSFLVWTTTPWTLPANVALAVGADIDYVKIKIDREFLILAKARLEAIDKYYSDFEIVEYYKGSQLKDWQYEPVFDFYNDKVDKKAWFVIEADFVSTEDGSGIVHIAPAFGEDDMEIGLKNNLPIILSVDPEGKFNQEVEPWAGKFVKQADPLIMEELKNRGVLISGLEETIEHDYPFCWRCDSPLIYYALEAWFVAVTEIQDKLIYNNNKVLLTDPSSLKHEGIRWVPEHLKEGRFGNWLEGAKDWNVSRNRFWGAPLPVWQCNKCENLKIIGSKEELGKKDLKDLHRPYIDDVKFDCTECGGEMTRVEQVFDCWFESGAMPYAQYNYPFANKEKFESGFPADFIAEGLDQTRGWFYTLHVLATALFNQPAFKNVIVNGLILAEDGKKLSKRLQNYTEPRVLFDKTGVDAVRYFLLTSTPIGEDYRFSDRLVEETLRKTVMLLNNIYSFYALYESSIDFDKQFKPDNLINPLDKWIVAKLNLLIKQVTEEMDNFDLTRASRPILDFINELSTWYLRRSRERFKGDDENDKKLALSTMKYVLTDLCKVSAPFLPFVSEDIYRKLKAEKDSVHLEDWPEIAAELIDTKLLEQMETVRKIIEQALAVRAEAGIKIRQPLGKLYITKKSLPEDLFYLIKGEVNVKEIIVSNEFPEGDNFKLGADENTKVCLDITMNEPLQLEGHARELIRNINALRKKQNLSINDLVTVNYQTDSAELEKTINEFNHEIKNSTLTKELIEGQAETEFDINGQKISITINKQ